MKKGQKLTYKGKGFIGYNPVNNEMIFISREGPMDYWVNYVTDNGKIKLLVRVSEVEIPLSIEINISQLLSNWDKGVVDLNRNKGMFKANNVRLRNCSLHYNEHCNEYYIKHKDTTYGQHDIYNLR